MARRRSAPLPEFTAHPATTPPAKPDLLDQLGFEHRQLQRLWSELQLSHRRHVVGPHRAGARFGLTGQRDLATQIVRLLAEHDARELELLYPIVGGVVGEEWAEHAMADHADVRALLDEVDGEDPEDEEVFAIYAEVMATMITHIDEEEGVIFPMLRAVVPPSQLANPGPLGTAAPEGQAEVIDLAAAEREAAEADDEGHETSKGGRTRLRLRRR